MILDDGRDDWREELRRERAEAEADRKAEWEAQRDYESSEAEKARWERIMERMAAERRRPHYDGDGPKR